MGTLQLRTRLDMGDAGYTDLFEIHMTQVFIQCSD